MEISLPGVKYSIGLYKAEYYSLESLVFDGLFSLTLSRGIHKIVSETVTIIITTGCIKMCCIRHSADNGQIIIS